MDKLRNRIALRFFIVVFVFMIDLFLFILIAKKLGLEVEYLKNPSSVIFVVGVLCFILSSVAAFHVMRTVFTPLEQISKAAGKVAEGDFSV